MVRINLRYTGTSVYLHIIVLFLLLVVVSVDIDPVVRGGIGEQRPGCE